MNPNTPTKSKSAHAYIYCRASHLVSCLRGAVDSEAKLASPIQKLNGHSASLSRAFAEVNDHLRCTPHCRGHSRKHTTKTQGAAQFTAQEENCPHHISEGQKNIEVGEHSL